MMQCSREFDGCVDVGFYYFEDEEVVGGDQLCIDELALKVCIALFDHGRADQGGRYGCQAELLELVHVAARGVSAAYHRTRYLLGGNVNDAFLAGAKAFKAVIVLAHDATDKRRLEFHHGVPGHGHDVRFVAVNGCDHDDRAGLKKGVDLGQRHYSLHWVSSFVELRARGSRRI